MNPIDADTPPDASREPRGAALSPPDRETAAPHRRRSSHHHHRSQARKPGAAEREQRLRRRQERTILSIFAPCLLAVVGGTIWAIACIDPDPSTRPHGLIRLAQYMLGIGVATGLIALLTDWTRRLLVIRSEKRRQTTEARARGRRRSSHRRHRHR